MLTFFPNPYPDEILYSVFARYHLRSGNVSFKSTLNDLFGSSTVIATIDLPSHIEALCTRLANGSSLTSSKVIDFHTLLPFYAPFMSEKRTENIKNQMCSNNGNSIHMTVGIMAGDFPAKSKLCFCQKCFEEDIANYGEPYWHRVHQAPGVLICPLHSKALVSYHKDNVSRHEYVPLPIIVSHSNTNLLHPNYEELSVKTKEFLFQISSDVSDLLSLSYNPLLYQSKQTVLQRLKEMGFATHNGQIRQDEFSEQFTLFYGQELLSLFHSSVKSEYSWLAYATRKYGRTTHPIRYLMLLRFLYGSFNCFTVNSKGIYSPFGSSPWPCLNKAAIHYKSAVITKCDVTICSDTKRPVGTFQCSCGFCYSRRGPDQKESDRIRIGRIKAFGTVWFTKLEQLMNQSGHSFRAIARMLGVDTNTVIKYIDKLKKGDKLKDKYLPTLKIVNPPLLVKLKCLFSKRKDKTNHNRGYTNWDLRDLELSVLVEEECKRLLNNIEIKPIRITWSLVAKRIGKSSLMQHESDNLIATKAVFEQYKETVEQFQIRRVMWASRILRETDMPLKRWKVERMACLRSGYSDEVEDEITNQIIQSSIYPNTTEGQQWHH